MSSLIYKIDSLDKIQKHFKRWKENLAIVILFNNSILLLILA